MTDLEVIRGLVTMAVVLPMLAVIGWAYWETDAVDYGWSRRVLGIGGLMGALGIGLTRLGVLWAAPLALVGLGMAGGVLLLAPLGFRLEPYFRPRPGKRSPRA